MEWLVGYGCGGQREVVDPDAYGNCGSYANVDTDAYAHAHGDAHAHTDTDADGYCGANPDPNPDASAGAGCGQWVAGSCGQRDRNPDLDAWRECYDALCGRDQAV